MISKIRSVIVTLPVVVFVKTRGFKSFTTFFMNIHYIYIFFFSQKEILKALKEICHWERDSHTSNFAGRTIM